MNHLSRMNVLEAPQYLIQEVPVTRGNVYDFLYEQQTDSE